jgi:hypothetical protein
MRGHSSSEQTAFTRESIVTTLLLALLLLGLPFLLASSPKIFEDGDVSWHIASGRWIIQHGRIPTTDPFSFTVAGRPWVAMEWLGDLIFASAFTVASYRGLFLVVATALLALNCILFLHLRRYVGAIGTASALVAMDVILGPFVMARPHVLVWPLLAGWTALLAEAADTDRPPPLWSTLILVAWTNIHGSFPLALPIATAAAFDSLWESKWRQWRAWGMFLVASAVALLLNANGIAGIAQPFKIADLGMLPLIQEWQPSAPSVTPQFYGILLLGLGVLLYKGVRVPPGRLVLLLLMLGLSFSHMRHQTWFAIVAATMIPPLFRTKPLAQFSVLPLGFALVPALVLRMIWPVTPSESAPNPWHLIAAIPAPLRSQPVFNSYSFGGPLILSGIRPYIDGRAEIYGDAFVQNYAAIADGDWAKFNDAVKRYGIRWTVLPASDTRLIQELDSSPDWQRFYSGKAGVVYVRRNVRPAH